MECQRPLSVTVLLGHSATCCSRCQVLFCPSMERDHRVDVTKREMIVKWPTSDEWELQEDVRRAALSLVHGVGPNLRLQTSVNLQHIKPALPKSHFINDKHLIRLMFQTFQLLVAGNVKTKIFYRIFHLWVIMTSYLCLFVCLIDCLVHPKGNEWVAMTRSVESCFASNSHAHLSELPTIL